MTKLKIKMLGSKVCSVSHNTSNAKIITTLPKEYGGIINEYSSSDLLAAALGTCIATTIEDILLRNRILLENVEIDVQKELAKSPRKIKYIAVNITIREEVDANVLVMIGKAAKTCLIHNSLRLEPRIRVDQLL